MDYRDEILRLLFERDAGKSICPSEVLPPESKQNKELMNDVRAAALELVMEGLIEVTQKGIPVSSETPKGPIRLRLKN